MGYGCHMNLSDNSQQPPGPGLLASLRSGWPMSIPPESRLAKPWGPGYWRPRHMIDMSAHDQDNHGVILMNQALLLPPLSCLYGNGTAANKAIHELLRSARKDLDDFEQPQQLPFPSSGFRFGQKRVPEELRKLFLSFPHFSRGPAQPTRPLITSRAEYSSESSRWAAAFYAYNPLLKSWYLIDRYGVAGESAYLKPFARHELAVEYCFRRLRAAELKYDELQANQSSPGYLLFPADD